MLILLIVSSLLLGVGACYLSYQRGYSDAIQDMVETSKKISSYLNERNVIGSSSITNQTDLRNRTDLN